MSVDSLRFVLGDQLSPQLSSLADLDPKRDVVLMAEVVEECTYVGHHPKKIAFILSAMRHFAAELSGRGIQVDYVKLDDPDNSGSFAGELERAVRRHRPSQVVVTEPGEYRVLADMETWSDRLGIPVEICQDDRFFCSRSDFADWAEGRKTLRMEHFYREMRKKSGFLMEPDGKPVGDRWNYDPENRKRLPKDVTPPEPKSFKPDEVTREVLDLVESRFGDHFGDLEPFWFAVTSAQAEKVFTHFVKEALARFGDYQDAMAQDRDTLFHSLIGLYLNAGLLDPAKVCRRVEKAYRDGDAPINAVEGYIRQILGWREFVRGIYWLKMPDYAESNALEAHRPLPAFYWTGETDMNCLSQSIGQTKRQAYAHHIQRLMVTGNFALLAGVEPKEVCAWYLAVYADAYEWVELPNTHGMALHADGGYLGSKPYAASGKYIQRMSDYCANCRYDVKETLGETACPFNALYWNFMLEQRERLQDNPRMAMPYRNLARMEPKRIEAIRRQAQSFLEGLEPAETGAS